jgi:uncharacterized membrane protein YdjX (TVP38/TMEM64 family)
MKRAFLGAILLLTIAACTWSYAGGGIMRTLLEPGISGDARLTGVREYFESWGAFAPLAYVAVVIVEVILAPIPGTLLYLPGGVIFGWFIGGLASLTGNVAGAGIACQIMRSLGRSYIEPYLERSQLRKYEEVIEARSLWIIFLLRVNPLTSSDLVSYAAGLTRIPVWKVMLGTMFGMMPLCFLQAYFAQEVFTVFPGLIYPLVFIGIVYLLYVIRLLRKLVRNRAVATIT